LVPRIVSTVADMHGFLPRSMGEEVSGRAPEQMSPYEAVLRSFAYFETLAPEELASVRAGLKLAVAKKPNYPDAWAMLALLEVQDYSQEAGMKKDTLESGLQAAQRAVEFGPANHLAYVSLAQALFFKRDIRSFRNAVEKAVTLNPADGSSMAALAELLTYAGEVERGLELAERARQLNPNHPGWYWFADFYDAYERKAYREALGFALRINMPGHYGTYATVAAAAGQLGEEKVGSEAMVELLKLRPDFGSQEVRPEMGKWFNQEHCEHILEGLRKAGLKLDDS